MSVRSLTLSNFRIYQQQHFQFDSELTVILGDNAAGKTSILEALHLLSTGKSFRATKIEEMIRFGAELARLQAVVIIPAGENEQALGETQIEDQDEEQEEEQVEALLTRGIVQGKRTPPTLFSLNGARKRKKDVVGQVLTTSFRPEDMRLVEGSPSRRRQFLDTPLSLVSSTYAYSLKTYEEALKKRNRLLQQIREGEMSPQVLTFWNLQLIKHGQVVQQLRREFIQFFTQVEFQVPFTITYDWSEISEARLQKYAQAEMAAGHTLVGPHKDDIIVNLGLGSQVQSFPNQVDIALYGSRGQQRLAVLWLKLGESLFVQERTDQLPTILLDDIMSELDQEHRELVMHLFKHNQMILTTTEPHIVKEAAALRSHHQLISLAL